MKKIIIFIALVSLFFGCTNQVTTEESQAMAAAEDSTTSISLSLTTPEGTTTVTKIVKQNRDTVWITVVTNTDGSIASVDIDQTTHIYKDPATPPPANNKPPSVKTGPDQTTSGTSVTLNGSGSQDPDGTIASYKWEQTKGNPATLTTVNAACTVTGLFTGHYTFKLTVADNYGATASDTIHVTVTGNTPPPSGNQLPIVTVGGSQTITLPASSVTLTGSATDGDGTIVSYLWTKTSGTGGTITSPAVKNTTVTGLAQGSYVFSLKATDNAGGSASKTVSVSVIGSTTPPPTGGGYPGYSIIYQNDFNFGTTVSKSQGKRISISTSVWKDGGGSLMAWYQAGDPSISSGYRDELQLSGSESPSNVDLIYEFDKYFEIITSGVDGLSDQWHGTQDGTSGNGSMWISGGKFVFMTQPSGVKGSANVYSSSLGTIQTGKWYKMRYEIKWSSSNGYVRVFIDNQLKYTLTGKICDGRGQYMKLGLNLFNGNNTAKVYYDNLKIYKK